MAKVQEGHVYALIGELWALSLELTSSTGQHRIHLDDESRLWKHDANASTVMGLWIWQCEMGIGSLHASGLWTDVVCSPSRERTPWDGFTQAHYLPHFGNIRFIRRNTQKGMLSWQWMQLAFCFFPREVHSRSTTIPPLHMLMAFTLT